jgi:hypothetical protein
VGGGGIAVGICRTRLGDRHMRPSVGAAVPFARSSARSGDDGGGRRCPATDHSQWPDIAMTTPGSANDRRQIRMFHVPAVMHISGLTGLRGWQNLDHRRGRRTERCAHGAAVRSVFTSVVGARQAHADRGYLHVVLRGSAQFDPPPASFSRRNPMWQVSAAHSRAAESPG